jgi:hypothetical protein
VVIAFWMTAGLLGRGVTQLRAERTTDIRSLQLLVELIGRFDRLMVIPGSSAVVLLFYFGSTATFGGKTTSHPALKGVFSAKSWQSATKLSPGPRFGTSRPPNGSYRVLQGPNIRTP